MDDDVARREHGAVGLVEAEPVGADVTGDRGDATGDLVVERVAELGAQVVEGVVADDLLLHPLVRGRAPAGTDHEHQLAPGNRPDEPLDEGGADEPGRTGDGDPSPRERLGDHGDDVYHSRLPFGRERWYRPQVTLFVSPIPARIAGFGDTNRRTSGQRALRRATSA